MGSFRLSHAIERSRVSQNRNFLLWEIEFDGNCFWSTIMANGGSHKDKPAEGKPKPTGSSDERKDGKKS